MKTGQSYVRQPAPPDLGLAHHMIDASRRPSFRSNSELAIEVADLDAALHFYAGVLGFRLVDRSEDHLELDTGALRLYVNRRPQQRAFIPSFDVDDAVAARRYLESSGCVTVPAGPDAEGVYFRDPFGFVFDVIERPR